MNNRFVFIIPSYNNENYVSKNLYSIINQLYNNWFIIYVDDNSDDNTYEIVSKIIKENNICNKTKLIKIGRAHV